MLNTFKVDAKHNAGTYIKIIQKLLGWMNCKFGYPNVKLLKINFCSKIFADHIQFLFSSKINFKNIFFKKQRSEHNK